MLKIVYRPVFLTPDGRAPDLYNKELQESYGVTTPEELVVEMIDDSGEWAWRRHYRSKKLITDGDPEANFIHYAIQKLHWSPSKIQEWLDADQKI